MDDADFSDENVISFATSVLDKPLLPPQREETPHDRHRPRR